MVEGRRPDSPLRAQSGEPLLEKPAPDVGRELEGVEQGQQQERSAKGRGGLAGKESRRVLYKPLPFVFDLPTDDMKVKATFDLATLWKERAAKGGRGGARLQRRLRQDNVLVAVESDGRVDAEAEPSYDDGWPTPVGAIVVRGREAQRARAPRNFRRTIADPRPDGGEPLAMACAGRDLERMHCHKFARA